MNPYLWRPEQWELAASAHLGWGMALTFALCLWFSRRTSAVILLAGVLLKEFLFDPFVEGDTFGNGLIDTLQFMAGLLAARTLLALADQWKRKETESCDA